MTDKQKRIEYLRGWLDRDEMKSPDGMLSRMHTEELATLQTNSTEKSCDNCGHAVAGNNKPTDCCVRVAQIKACTDKGFWAHTPKATKDTPIKQPLEDIEQIPDELKNVCVAIELTNDLTDTLLELIYRIDDKQVEIIDRVNLLSKERK